MTREENIVHENGCAWVLRDAKGKCYTVFLTGVTCSTSDSSYALTEDGLGIAVCRANYLARRYAGQILGFNSAGKVFATPTVGKAS